MASTFLIKVTRGQAPQIFKEVDDWENAMEFAERMARLSGTTRVTIDEIERTRVWDWSRS
jgi:hypothetical protein